MFSVETIVGSMVVVLLINSCEDRSVCSFLCVLIILSMIWYEEN